MANLPTPGAGAGDDRAVDRRSLRERRTGRPDTVAAAPNVSGAETVDADAVPDGRIDQTVDDDPFLDGRPGPARTPDTTDSLVDLARELPPELNILRDITGRPDPRNAAATADDERAATAPTTSNSNAPGRQHLVKPGQPLEPIIERANPGDEIILWAGTYRGISLRGVRGLPGRPIVIRGLDRNDPPVIEGGAWGIRMLGAQHIELSDLIIRRPRIDGIEIAPSEGSREPVGPIDIVRVTIEDVGERAGRHGIRIVHGNRVRLREVTVRGWTGSGIELVGCHDAIIERGVLEGRNRGEMIGIRLRGGTADAIVRRTVMLNPGRGGVVLGGRTRESEYRGMERYASDDVRWEVAGPTLDQVSVIGSEVGLTLLGVVDGSFSRLSIIDPTRSFLRLGRPLEDGSVPAVTNAAIDASLFHAAAGTDPALGEIASGATAEGLSLSNNLWWRVDDPWAPETDFPGFDSLPQRTDIDPDLDETGMPQAPDASGYGAY